MTLALVDSPITESKPVAASGRLAQFERAHIWRLATVSVAVTLRLTYKDITSKGRDGNVIHRLAAAVSDEVGFNVAYHSMWKFFRSDLAKAYFDGSAPTPAEQFKASCDKQRTHQSRRPAQRRTKPVSHDSIGDIVTSLREAANQLEAAYAGVAEIVSEHAALTALFERASGGKGRRK